MPGSPGMIGYDTFVDMANRPPIEPFREISRKKGKCQNITCECERWLSDLCEVDGKKYCYDCYQKLQRSISRDNHERRGSVTTLRKRKEQDNQVREMVREMERRGLRRPDFINLDEIY